MGLDWWAGIWGALCFLLGAWVERKLGATPPPDPRAASGTDILGIVEMGRAHEAYRRAQKREIRQGRGS